LYRRYKKYTETNLNKICVYFEFIKKKSNDTAIVFNRLYTYDIGVHKTIRIMVILNCALAAVFVMSSLSWYGNFAFEPQ
jgi:hypothetical protein